MLTFLHVVCRGRNFPLPYSEWFWNHSFGTIPASFHRIPYMFVPHTDLVKFSFRSVLFDQGSCKLAFDTCQMPHPGASPEQDLLAPCPLIELHKSPKRRSRLVNMTSAGFEPDTKRACDSHWRRVWYLEPKWLRWLYTHPVQRVPLWTGMGVKKSSLRSE